MTADQNPFFGRVLCTHGLGTDQPIGLTRYNFVDLFGECVPGTLPRDKQEATGPLYRRNRYYDPASGRFTQ